MGFLSGTQIAPPAESDHLFPVQPRRFGSQDEELRAVGVRTGVRHAHLVHEHTQSQFHTSYHHHYHHRHFDKLCPGFSHHAERKKVNPVTRKMWTLYVSANQRNVSESDIIV